MHSGLAVFNLAESAEQLENKPLLLNVEESVRLASDSLVEVVADVLPKHESPVPNFERRLRVVHEQVRVALLGIERWRNDLRHFFLEDAELVVRLYLLQVLEHEAALSLGVK